MYKAEWRRLRVGDVVQRSGAPMTVKEVVRDEKKRVLAVVFIDECGRELRTTRGPELKEHLARLDWVEIVDPDKRRMDILVHVFLHSTGPM